MNARHLLLATASVVALSPAVSRADAAPADDRAMVFSPMAGFAFTAGGTPLVHVVIVNENTGAYMGSTAVKAGGQDYLYLGGELRFPRSHLALQGTVGYHWDSKGGNNLDVTFSRLPIEVIGLYQPLSSLRIGGGVRYDTRVNLSGKGDADIPELQQKYGNAFGPVLKVEYLVLPDTGIELRWSKMTYKLKSVGGADAAGLGYSVDGRSFGAGVNLHF
jgi:hypothetical protein